MGLLMLDMRLVYRPSISISFGVKVREMSWIIVNFCLYLFWVSP